MLEETPRANEVGGVVDHGLDEVPRAGDRTVLAALVPGPELGSRPARPVGAHDVLAREQVTAIVRSGSPQRRGE